MRRAAGFTLVELLVAMVISAIIAVIGYRALDQALRSRKEVDEQTARLIAVQQALRTIEQDIELLQARPIRQPTGDGYLPAFMSAANVGSMLSSSSSSTFSNSGSSSSGGGFSSSSSGGSSSFGSSSGGLAGSVNGDSSVTISTLGTLSTVNGGILPLVSFTRGGWTNPAGLPRPELQRVSYSIENGALVRSYTPELDSPLSTQPIKRTLIDHVKRFGMRFMDAGHNWQSQWPVQTVGGVDQQTIVLRYLPVAVEVTIELEDWGVIMRHIEGPG
jgi:prepilin-type N-terminal cleavage/methylation domain-containing protein